MKLFYIFIHTGAITEKFGDVKLQKKWDQIRQSLNQNCLDSKRKLKSDENVTEG